MWNVLNTKFVFVGSVPHTSSWDWVIIYAQKLCTLFVSIDNSPLTNKCHQKTSLFSQRLLIYSLNFSTLCRFLFGLNHVLSSNIYHGSYASTHMYTYNMMYKQVVYPNTSRYCYSFQARPIFQYLILILCVIYDEFQNVDRIFFQYALILWTIMKFHFASCRFSSSNHRRRFDDLFSST